MTKVSKNTNKPEPTVVAENYSPAMKIIATLLEYSADNVSCIVVTLLALALSIYLMMKMKKSNEDTAEKKDDEIDEPNKGGKMKTKTDVTDNVENDSESDGQEASEEDLPWLLQKAPSETSLKDGKRYWADEKHSECSGSDKSQESVMIIQKGSASGDTHVSKIIKIITAEDDNVHVEG